MLDKTDKVPTLKDHRWAINKQFQIVILKKSYRAQQNQGRRLGNDDRGKESLLDRVVREDPTEQRPECSKDRPLQV